MKDEKHKIRDDRGYSRESLEYPRSLLEGITIEDAKRLIEELWIRQIELKIQNAHLREAYDELAVQMAEQKIAERFTRESNRILRLTAEASSRKEYLDGMLELVQEWSGCRCIGIRVVDYRGYIPYESYVGFSKEFWEKENWLSLGRDNCACIRVITGEHDPLDGCCMTPGGSFRVNDSIELLDTISEEGIGRFRGVCVKSGFLSILVIPVRCEGKMLGAIHIADERKGMVSDELVGFMEKMAPLMGEGIRKFNIKDSLKQHYETQEAINSFLRLAFSDIELEELLSHALDIVLSVPWLSLHKTGAIFLLEKESNTLVMKAQRGLDARVSKGCERVPVGECICGEVAQSGHSRFIDRAGEGYRVMPETIFPHGQYCIPIKILDRMLGVMNIYVGEKPRPDEKEEEYLIALAGALGVCIDAAERKRAEEILEEQKVLLEAILRQAADGIVAIDAHGNFTFINAAARRMALLDPEDASLQVAEDFWGKAYTPDGMPLPVEKWSLQRALRGEVTVGIESRMVRPDGSHYDVSISAAPLKKSDGTIMGAVSILSDISERKQAEEALKNYAKQLELLNQDLQEFAFVASHDLHEPLRKIQSFGDTLNRRYKDRLGEEGQDFLNRMTGAARRMQELLQGLLNYSRVTTRTNPFKEIDLNKVVEDTISDLELALGRAGGCIEVGALPRIEADEPQMRQLFQNLIGNAMKYQYKGNKPLVKIYSEIEGDTCRIFVEDNGIGFEEKYVDVIFKPFQRLHGLSSEYEGTGMGLAICRKIVERHGGSITAASQPEKGSRFIITLPAGACESVNR